MTEGQNWTTSPAGSALWISRAAASFWTEKQDWTAFWTEKRADTALRLRESIVILETFQSRESAEKFIKEQSEKPANKSYGFAVAPLEQATDYDGMVEIAFKTLVAPACTLSQTLTSGLT